MKKHRLLYIPIAFLFLLSFVDCAKRGTPNGGKRDSIPPVIVKSSPENFSINFDTDEISIQFDEYIKLKDIQQNLIVSPPLKYQPLITPLSTSKVLKIKILDTLKENTTYSFNFGKSIVDNNEDNEFEYFKYVFSTGTYIDSLTLGGSVRDALVLKSDKVATVVLYEVNEAFNDSTIFKEKPNYVSVVNDSSQTFELTNLREGKYLLLGLQEDNNDYTFNPSQDRIGFLQDFITIPTDSTYDIKLFKEELDYEISRPKHEGKNKIMFGYTGNIDSLQLSTNTPLPSNFESRITKDLKKDTLYYWFKPAFDLEQEDTLQFIVKNKTQIDTLDTRLRDLFTDSLKIKSVTGTTLILRDTMQLTSTTPIESLDSTKIQIMSRDSVFITPSVLIDKEYNTAGIIFEKAEAQAYKIDIFPDAFKDYFGQTNDTLRYSVRTQEDSDYGTLTLNLVNAKEFPIIVQLVDTKFNVISEEYLTELTPVYFDYLLPSFYYLRIIEDSNSNKMWDTGNFLKRVQPENVIYFPGQIEIRANWSWNETFTLD